MKKKVFSILFGILMVAQVLLALPAVVADDAELVLEYSEGYTSLMFPDLVPGQTDVQATNAAVLSLSGEGTTYSEIDMNFHAMFNAGSYVPTYENLLIDWVFKNGNATLDSGQDVLDGTHFVLSGLLFQYPLTLEITPTILVVPETAKGDYTGLISITAMGQQLVGGSPTQHQSFFDGGQSRISVESYPELSIEFTGGYDELSFQTLDGGEVQSINYMKIKNTGNRPFVQINCSMSDFEDETGNESFIPENITLVEYVERGDELIETGEIIIIEDGHWEFGNTYRNEEHLYMVSMILPPHHPMNALQFRANFILETLYLTDDSYDRTPNNWAQFGWDAMESEVIVLEEALVVDYNDTFAPFMANDVIIFEELTQEGQLELLEPIVIDNQHSTVGVSAVEFYFTNLQPMNGGASVPLYARATMNAHRGGLTFSTDLAIEEVDVLIDGVTYTSKAVLPFAGAFGPTQVMNFGLSLSEMPISSWVGEYRAQYAANVISEIGISPAPSYAGTVLKTPEVEILYGLVGSVETDVNVDVDFLDGADNIHFSSGEEGVESNTLLFVNNEPQQFNTIHIIYSSFIGDEGLVDVDLSADFGGNTYFPDSSGAIIIYNGGDALIEVGKMSMLTLTIFNAPESMEGDYQGSIQLLLENDGATTFALSPVSMVLGDGFWNGFGDWTLQSLLNIPVADMGFEVSGVTPTRTAPEGSIVFDASASYDPSNEAQPNQGIEVYLWWWGDLVQSASALDYPDSFQATTSPLEAHEYVYDDLELFNNHIVTLFVLDDVGAANIMSYLEDQGYGSLANVEALVEALMASSGGPSGGILYAVMGFMSTQGNLGVGKQTGLLSVIETPIAPTFELTPASLNGTGNAGEEIAVTFYVTPTFNIAMYDAISLGVDVDVTQSDTQTIDFLLTVVNPTGQTIVNHEIMNGTQNRIGNLLVDDGLFTVTLFITLETAGDYHSAYDVYLVGETFYGDDVLSEEATLEVDYVVGGSAGSVMDYIWWILGAVVIAGLAGAGYILYRKRSTKGQMSDVQQNIRSHVGVRGQHGPVPPSGGVEEIHLNPPYGKK